MSLFKVAVCIGIGPIGCTTKKWSITCLFEEGTAQVKSNCINYGIMHVVPLFLDITYKFFAFCYASSSVLNFRASESGVMSRISAI